MEIKIGGLITEDSQLYQIQYVAKIFAYEQRMKKFRYTPPLELLPQKTAKKCLVKHIEIEGLKNTLTTTLCPVRGLV